MEISEFLLRDTALSKEGTLAFMGFCIADLLVGSIVYPSQLNPATGWAHHLGYIGMLAWFIKTSTTMCFTAFALCELPTFLLSLKRCRDPLESGHLLDGLFGLTFFLTRIVYYGWILVRVCLDPGMILPRRLFAVFIFAMHAHWMRTWFQRRIARAFG